MKTGLHGQIGVEFDFEQYIVDENSDHPVYSRIDVTTTYGKAKRKYTSELSVDREGKAVLVIRPKAGLCRS